MAVSIRQIHSHFVGEVSGLDLRKPLTPDEAREVEAAMDRYAVLVFHDQDIDDEQQLRFAANFGPRENRAGGTVTRSEDYRLSSGLADVGNLGKDGKPLPKDHRTHLFNLGNCLWHSDSSFRPVPAKFSLLSARVVNPTGGNTEFADMRAAYDALDDATKAEIEDMICEHSLMYSRGALGFLDYSEDEKRMFKPVLQRLVRTHPVHGRKSLYLSSHAGGIVGICGDSRWGLLVAIYAATALLTATISNNAAVGTPASMARFLAATLSPSRRIWSGVGPTQMSPASMTACAKSAFSARNP